MSRADGSATRAQSTNKRLFVIRLRLARIANKRNIAMAAFLIGALVMLSHRPFSQAEGGDTRTAMQPMFQVEWDDQVHACPHHDCLMTIEAEEVLSVIAGVSDRETATQLEPTAPPAYLAREHPRAL